ncbi:MAG TPA: acyl-CoA thioesterase [Acetobacteraceae bacterium]|nr:acyl-CoA thioesterase [Acetobacteraceae bacterium]
MQAAEQTRPEPQGELALRTLAMPKNTNPSGDIFGGWIMSLMDLAAGLAATARANGRVVTASVSHLSFLAPVKVGDAVCCYAELVRVGRSSMIYDIETWVLPQRLSGAMVKVTEAQFTMVAVDETGRPRPTAT